MQTTTALIAASTHEGSDFASRQHYSWFLGNWIDWPGFKQIRRPGTLQTAGRGALRYLGAAPRTLHTPQFQRDWRTEHGGTGATWHSQLNFQRDLRARPRQATAMHPADPRANVNFPILDPKAAQVPW